MATPFTDIYERAIFRVKDYDILQKDIETKEDLLQHYLMSAKSDFQKVCKNDLGDVDLAAKQFNNTLDDEVIEILALGVAYYWLSPYALSTRLLKNKLSSKDYYWYSPGNLLNAVSSLRKEVRREFRSRINRYSYDKNNIGDVRS